MARRDATLEISFNAIIAIDKDQVVAFPCQYGLLGQ